MALHAVILAGGSGTRFWPLSTKGRPKHLLALLGRRTLLEETAARLRGLVPAARTVVVTAKEQAAEVRRLLPSLPRGAVIAEPLPRNTAAAVALAAARIRARDRDAVLVVVSADHWIPDAAGFRRTMAAAAARARAAGTLVVVGVRPDRPATGYGYVLPGKVAARVKGFAVRRVARFTEKPGLATARRWLRARTRLWNAGMFAWRADAFLEEVRLRLPALHRALVASGAWAGGAATLARAYARAPSISLDVGILERSPRVEMVEAAFPWDDLGSFAALHRRLGGTPHEGARSGGGLLEIDGGGNLSVAARDHLTVVLGGSRLAVITTPKVTLVVPLDRAEEVRLVAKALRGGPRSLRGLE
jgi:mannose-1-phosphate guanylyltransferase